MRQWTDWVGSCLVLSIVVALWWVASHQRWISNVFLPTPEATMQALHAGFGPGGELTSQSCETIQRMVEGWLLACIGGVAFGILIGTSHAARSWLEPTLEFIRPLPASAVLPPAISIFGLGPPTVLFVIAFGATWPVLLATIHGFASVHPRLREVAAALEIPRLHFVCKFGLPSAMPDILAGMRLSMTVSLIVAVVGEMIASQPGLGQAVLLAARSFRASDLFAGTVLLGMLGFASNALLGALEHRLLRWQIAL